MLLSIIICNHNYERFLESAIVSALGQSYPNKEIVVVDDGSTDSSPQIIAQWSDKVRAVFQSNEGQISAYNRGYRESRGEVIIFLDSDDILDPETGEKVVAAFADPEVVKVHYRMRLIDPNNELIGPVIPRRLAEDDVRDVLLKRGMLYDSSPGSGNAYRRAVLDRLMPLPDSSSDRHGADFFALLGISLLGKVKALGPEPLGSYRLHLREARDQLGFGNVGLSEPLKTQLRYGRLQQWLVDRLGPDYKLPREFVDFSTQKQVFANLIMTEHRYFDGLRKGSDFLTSTLLRSIWRRTTPAIERIGLTGWALAVLVLPREMGRPIARYVCNPASRNFSF